MQPMAMNGTGGMLVHRTIFGIIELTDSGQQIP